MNTKRFLCAALGAVCCFAFMQAQVRTEQTFEKGWKFTREDNAEFANPGYNDSKWQNVTVPHDWAIYGPFSINNDKQEMAEEMKCLLAEGTELYESPDRKQKLLDEYTSLCEHNVKIGRAHV